MLKLAAIVAAAATAATTTYVAHRASERDPAPTRHTAAGPGGNESGTGARSARMPASGLGHVAPSGVAAFGAPPSPALPAQASAVGDECRAVARHMGNLALAYRPDTGEGSDRVELVAAPLIDQIAQQCTSMGWSHDYIACLIGETDAMTAHFDCDHLAPATAQEPPVPDGEVASIATTTRPVPPTDDISCAGVAKHMVDLSEPDADDLARVPADQREMITGVIQDVREHMPAQVEAACTRMAWSEDRRRCVASAQTEDALGRCL